MRRTYTSVLVALTAALLLLACVLFALAQGGQEPRDPLERPSAGLVVAR